uniref:Mucin-2-like n=1 Tax=Oryzias latipes TaxID=8090 RepID=A0A3B3I7T5_ORYLA
MHIDKVSSCVTECPSPKTFFNCSTATKEELDLQCAQSCLNVESLECDFTECASGCRCPVGLLDDGRGSCVNQSDCPCQHDGHLFNPGQQISNQCNKCTCRSGKWDCTRKRCPQTCVIYGSGHYNTFDQRTYGFQGFCSYVATKNNCGNKTSENSFAVITENVPCGSTGTTCSKNVRIHLGGTEIKLTKGKYEVEKKAIGSPNYRVRTIGLYLVIESDIGVAVLWDRKTTVRIRLEPKHTDQVCGLCGNFDGDGQNDFNTQSQMIVGNTLEFANSWKVYSTCPDVDVNVDPCDAEQKRYHWSKMMCSIITGETFSQCHNKVDPQKFFDNCVKDSCACDTGGDCECFCSAVAAYAQACNEAGVCVAWRTPDICPVFCDYYNHHGDSNFDCKWHYNPCHPPCYKTCSNPEGICGNTLPKLEGCFPECPNDKPIFDEKSQECVESCPISTIPPTTTAITTETTTTTTTSTTETPTTTPTTITTTTTTTETPTTTLTTITTTISTTTTETTTTTTSTTTQIPTTPTTPCTLGCEWSGWYNVHDPWSDKNDLETYENIIKKYPSLCDNPKEIDCRSADYPEMTLDQFLHNRNQVVKCDVKYGLMCKQEDQPRRPGKCLDYKIRVCCPTNTCRNLTTPFTTPTTESTTSTTTTTTTTTDAPSTTPTTTTTTTTTTETPTTTPTTTTTKAPTTTPTTITPTTTTETPTTTPTTTTTTTTTTATETPTTAPTTTTTTTTETPTTPTTTATTTETPTTAPTTLTTTTTTTGTPTTTTTTTTTTTETPTTTPSTTTTTTETPTTPTTTTTTTETPTTAPTTTTTTTTTETPTTTTSTTTQIPTTPTTPCTLGCEWSDWYNVHDPWSDKNDLETYENIIKKYPSLCDNPKEIDCRSADYPEMTLDQFLHNRNQVVKCDVKYGLMCKKEDQPRRPGKCLDYKIRVCCPTNTCRNLTTPFTTLTTESTTSTTTTTTTTTEAPSSTPTTTTTTTTTTETPTTTPTTATTETPTTTPTTITPTTTIETPTTTPTTTATTTTTTTTETPTTTTTTTTETPTTTPTTTTTKAATTTLTTVTTTTTTTETPTTTPTTSTTSTTTDTPTITATTTATTIPSTYFPSSLSATTSQSSTLRIITGPTKTTNQLTSNSQIVYSTTTSITISSTPTTITATPTKTPTTKTTTTTTTTTETPTTTPATTTTITTTTETPTTTPTTTTTATTETPTTTPTTITTTTTTTENPTTTPTTITTTTSTETPTTVPTTTSPTTTSITTTTSTTTETPTTTPTTITTTTTTTETPTTTPTTISTTTTTTKTPTTTPITTTTTKTTITTITEMPTTTPTTTTTETPTTTPSTTTTTTTETSTKTPTTTNTTLTTSLQTPTTTLITSTTPTTTTITTTTTTENPTTLRLTTSTTTTITSTTPTTIPLTTPGCDNLDVGEFFHWCNCTMAICVGDNQYKLVPYECPTIEPIICANGKEPVLVYDEYHCCQHYACDCVCEGWGDPHYITVDGLYYSYQGNCTYVLVEEIVTKYHLKIYIDNVFCDVGEDVSCPRSIIISFRSQTVKLINHNPAGGRPDLEAQRNGAKIQLPYSQYGLKIMSSGIDLILEMPFLEIVVTFGMTGFSIELPYKYFGNNIQGHCGTCNNNQTDDCMLPGGRLASTCAVMADYWVAKDIKQPYCPPPPPLPTEEPEPPQEPPCKHQTEHSLCDLINKGPFKDCHPSVSPDNFYKGCVYDSCYVSNPAVQCTSLQTYAAACAQAGVCINWRNHTKLCNSNCDSGKVYKPCGLAQQPTCEDNPQEEISDVFANYTVEGCFCPEGMKLFNRQSGICVKKCGCLDPKGIPREFNETFEYQCQECTCSKSTKTVTCTPKTCPRLAVPSCTEGFVLVNQTNPEDPCCPFLTCQCHLSTCKNIDSECEAGHKAVVKMLEGKCCPELICEPKNVCVYNGTEYMPKSSFPTSKCQDCTCSNEVDRTTGLLKINCSPMQCDQKCAMGFVYEETNSGDCCGKCVQKYCVVSVNGTDHLLMPGETWSPLQNSCEQYSCGGTFTISTSSVVCPPFQQSNCKPDTIQTAANGCCKICVEKDSACNVTSMKTHVSQNDCQSKEEVDMPYCEGSCITFTRYSAPKAAMQHTCSCCKEARFSNRTIDLVCKNGRILPFSYMFVEECSCSQTSCTDAEHARRKRSFTLQ